jgi:TolA-binding protein
MTVREHRTSGSGAAWSLAGGLGLALLLASPTAARAQASGTSTAGEALLTGAVEDAEAGRPGSVISLEEYQPIPPPTAAEVESPQSFEEQLKRLELELVYYQAGAQSFDEDMRNLIRLKYNEQKDLLAAQYDRAIAELEEKERVRRLEAIARFEEFLKKYPDDPIYTPDAMFRLAELYYEKSSDEYLTRSRGYEAELAAYEAGQRETEPPPPEPSFEKTIGLHRDLLSRFPNYRLADAARYLLGYCYGEQGQTDEALAAYLELTEKHPDSKFLAEVWTRVGEIYFDGNTTEALKKAIAAYQKVRQYPDSPYYDKALYKIAWTYYRLDLFDEAVASFIELVDYADEQKRLTGTSGSELRAEAIQYIAISLADDEWGGLERAKAVLEPIEAKEYTGELWKRYGEILYDQTRYALAIDVLRYTLKKYPNAPYNPEAQSKIVNAYEQLRDFDGATAAREELVQNYSQGSAWYEANKDDREAIATAESLTERSLYTAAIFRHQQAQAHKQAGRLSQAKTQYLAAADAYKKYLDRFPQSKNAYDFQFFLAECLYYSGDYLAAAKQYDAVRDSKLDNKHLEAAALSSVISYEKEIEGQVKGNKLPDYPVRTAAERKDKAIEPKEIAPVRKELISSSDRFATILPKSERAPAVRYRAAEIFYKHDQLDEARRRFEQVVAEYPASEVARYASNLIIESYLAVQDWESVEKWSQRLIEVAQTAGVKDGEEKAKTDFIDSLKTFKVGAQFKQAEEYDAAGKFEEAADTYVRLVDDNPKHEFADKALFNAAVAYEKVKRFDTASRIYQRIYDQYASSELAPRSLFRVGINAEKGFDFPQAIIAYQRLVERYPDSENRADALYNLAVVLENQQDYAKAAEAFKRYATTFPSRDDAGDIYFRAALVYEKMTAWNDMVTTLGDYIKKYDKVASQKERIIEAHKKIGDAQMAQNKEALAQRAFKSCVEQFTAKRLSVSSRAARGRGGLPVPAGRVLLPRLRRAEDRGERQEAGGGPDRQGEGPAERGAGLHRRVPVQAGGADPGRLLPHRPQLRALRGVAVLGPHPEGVREQRGVRDGVPGPARGPRGGAGAQGRDRVPQGVRGGEAHPGDQRVDGADPGGPEQVRAQRVPDPEAGQAHAADHHHQRLRPR